MSTTRPLAREITGISLATSGKTAPVTFNSAGASRNSAATSGNCSGLSTDTRLMSPVGTIVVDGGAPSAGENSFLHAVREAKAARQIVAKKKDLLVIEHLVPHGEI